MCWPWIRWIELCCWKGSYGKSTGTNWACWDEMRHVWPVASCLCVCESIDLYITVIRNRDVCVISARRSMELHTESAALRVQGERVKVTERLQRHNCGQVCAFPERGRGLSLFLCLSLSLSPWGLFFLPVSKTVLHALQTLLSWPHCVQPHHTLITLTGLCGGKKRHQLRWIMF